MTDDFDPTKNEATISKLTIRTVRAEFDDFTFTDVTFAWLGEFYGCRFHGFVDVEVERRLFMARRLKCQK